MNITKPLITITLALSAAAAGAQAMDTSNPDTTPGPTRAEVRADLAIYRESGLLDLDRVQNTDPNSPQYRAALKRYTELRRSVHFADLVRQYGGGDERRLAKAASPRPE